MVLFKINNYINPGLKKNYSILSTRFCSKTKTRSFTPLFYEVNKKTNFNIFKKREFWTEIFESIKVFLDSIFVSTNINNTENTTSLSEEIKQITDLTEEETNKVTGLTEEELDKIIYLIKKELDDFDYLTFFDNIKYGKSSSTSSMPVKYTVIGSSNNLNQTNFNTTKVVSVFLGDNLFESLENLDKVATTTNQFQLINIDFSKLHYTRELLMLIFGQTKKIQFFQKQKNYFKISKIILFIIQQ